MVHEASMSASRCVIAPISITTSFEIGLIVQTKGGSLGVEGKGTAPHWRLTECGYLKDPPTRDFLNWNGDKFRDNPKGRPNRRGKNKNRIPSWNSVTPRNRNGNPLHNGVTESHYTNGNKCNGNP